MSKLKFVYALASGESDYYAEQALMSMHSLRMHNPDGHIVLAADRETVDTFGTGGRSHIKDYVDELVVIDTPQGFTPLQRSRYVKTLIREYVEGDFLYLDCDTVVMGRLDGPENSDADVAGVAFRHVRDWGGELPDRLVRFYKKTGIQERLEFPFFCNGGVILCKDNEAGHLLFELWHKLWLECSTKYGYDFDQCNLWRANALAGGIMRELDGIYNCQILYPGGMSPYIDDCRVFHYFSNSRHFNTLSCKRTETMRRIREHGVDAVTEAELRTLKEEYFDSFIIPVREDMEIYNSPLVVLSRKLSRDYPWMNKLAKSVYGLFGIKI